MRREPQSQAIVHGHADNGIDAIDIQPIRQQEQADHAQTAHVG
jgi:hypothetical protein